MGRSRKNQGATAPATEEEATTEPAAEEVAEPEAPATTTTTPVPEPANPLAGPKAQPRHEEAPVAAVPKRRDLGGLYECVTRVSINGKIEAPGTELTLDDAQARYYLAAHAVQPLD